MTALVLLPGMDGTGDLFAPLLLALPTDITPLVIRYPRDRALDYAALEILVRQALPAGAPFVLLAESFSGPLGAAIAARPPEGMRGLILCGSFVRPPRPRLAFTRALAGWLPPALLPRPLLNHVLLGGHATPALRAALGAAVSSVSAAAMQARLKAVMETDMSARFAGVRLPVLYLRGRDDRVVPRSASETVAALAPNTQIVELPAPHCILQAVPRDAAQAIAAFMKALEPAAQA
ncbi:alpha/beta hydrolase [Cupriavidus basilensis]|uniref:Alpha/beta hydrolase n=1 Tax=Cupriavidus basilensis TaxID=68895 RepID=A0ABT6AQN7_9BURK|nr:alpha/beta hydrolase [Cupriavidus basilensis]MDF3834929.1 alpha/beta hydrolase [Cupriavidus basilensis]